MMILKRVFGLFVIAIVAVMISSAYAEKLEPNSGSGMFPDPDPIPDGIHEQMPPQVIPEFHIDSPGFIQDMQDNHPMTPVNNHEKYQDPESQNKDKIPPDPEQGNGFHPPPVDPNHQQPCHDKRIHREWQQYPYQASTYAGNTGETGTLSVTSNPEGASVYVDGSYSGQTPVQLSLTAGNHSILITYPGYNDYSTPVSITGGQGQSINADL